MVIYMPYKRRFNCDNEFFTLGNIESNMYGINKQLSYQTNYNDFDIPRPSNSIELGIDTGIDILQYDLKPTRIVCHEPPCNGSIVFPSIVAYERHYDQQHQNQCIECGAVFPSAQWLDLHIQEIHDMFFQAQVARGYSVYRCFLQTCTCTFISAHIRRLHMIETHQFAKSFNWNLVQYGLNHGNSAGSKMLNDKGGRGITSLNEMCASTLDSSENMDIS